MFICESFVGDLGWIPGLGRSPGEGNGYPVQHSGVENSMVCIVSPWGHKELNTTEQLLLSLSFHICATLASLQAGKGVADEASHSEA